MLLMSVQPPISTIPCETLYPLANPVLPFPVFSSQSSQSPSPSSDFSSFCSSTPRCSRCGSSAPRRSLGRCSGGSSDPCFSPVPALPRPFHSNRCHPERSEGSAFLFSPIRALSVSAFTSPDARSFNSKLSTACPERSRRVNTPSLSPFPATLTDGSQLTENPATLSPVPATLTSRVKHNPFVCHSCKKHPGWGPAIVNFFVAQISDLAVRQVTSHKSPVTASALFLPPVTGHQSQVTKSFTIRTYEKHARNSRRIRTSKTQDLKLFRINTYKKTGRGPAPTQNSVHPSSWSAEARFVPGH